MTYKSLEVKRKSRKHYIYIDDLSGRTLSKEEACTIRRALLRDILRNPLSILRLFTRAEIRVIDVILSLGGCVVIDPTQRYHISREADCTERTVRRAMQKITAFGLCSKKYRPWKSCVYKISQLFTLSCVRKLLSSHFENINYIPKFKSTFFNLGKKLIERNVLPILRIKGVTNKFGRVGPDGLTIADVFDSVFSNTDQKPSCAPKSHRV